MLYQKNAALLDHTQTPQEGDLWPVNLGRNIQQTTKIWVLRLTLWLCAQGSLLAGFRGSLGARWMQGKCPNLMP